MYILASDFFETDETNRNKSDDYLYLYIINLENSRLKLVFQYTIGTYPFVFVLVGREYKMDIVLSKNRC